jgi:hypothetical protein
MSETKTTPQWQYVVHFHQAGHWFPDATIDARDEADAHAGAAAAVNPKRPGVEHRQGAIVLRDGEEIKAYGGVPLTAT